MDESEKTVITKGRVIEAIDGKKFLVKVIQSGVSVNGTDYPKAVLKKATQLFNGVRVFAKSDAEHLAFAGKDVRNLIGRLSNARFAESYIEADFELLTTAPIAPMIQEAVERDMATDLFGFSVDVIGEFKKGLLSRKVEAVSISKVLSLDLIIEASAGGEMIRVIEAIDSSKQTIQPEDLEMSLKARMIEAIKSHNGGQLPDDLDIDNEDSLTARYAEALKPPTQAPQQETMVSAAEFKETLRMVEARNYATNTINNNPVLPDFAKSKLSASFVSKPSFTPDDVNDAIKNELEYLARVTESGHVQGLGQSGINSAVDASQNIDGMFDALLDENDNSAISLKECYRQVTGDVMVTGDLRNCNMARMRECAGVRVAEGITSSTFANVLGDAINRRLYKIQETPAARYDIWRDLVRIVPKTDFETNKLTQYGGYGDLPIVPESGSYAPLSTPTDKKEEYSLAKRGGIETVTMEAIRRDDVGLIMNIPDKLNMTSQRTLGKFVLDLIATNPLMADGNNVFHAAHNNLGTAALSTASLSAARLAMMQQVDISSGERLGIPPMHLWLPSELEEVAFDLFRRATDNDDTFSQSMRLQVHPVWYWSDVNDWAVTADPRETAVIELGFLDGQQDASIFLQDNPTSGSVFSNDVLTYKIRHAYGANWIDHRGAYKSSVV